MIAELWSRFSHVAAGNPYAWLREPRSPEEIATITPQNRIIGLPYRKVMNSNNDVDMGAALIMCSVERAEALGIARDRWVFPHSGTDCHEHNFVSNRWTFSDTPAIRLGGQRALDLAGVGIDDIAIVDLYSCFPSAVQLGARVAGLSVSTGSSPAPAVWRSPADRGTTTSCTRSPPSSASSASRPASAGSCGATAGTSRSTRSACTAPSRHRRASGSNTPRTRSTHSPAATWPKATTRRARPTIEAYTVMFDRDGNAEVAIATCLLDDGRRAWATSGHADVTAALLEGEWVGRRVVLGNGGELRV